MSDQLISNYWPLLQNPWYWVALFMHGLDIARMNLFIVCKSQAKIIKQSAESEARSIFWLGRLMHWRDGQMQCITEKCAGLQHCLNLLHFAEDLSTGYQTQNPSSPSNASGPCPTEKQQQCISRRWWTRLMARNPVGRWSRNHKYATPVM